VRSVAGHRWAWSRAGRDHHLANRAL